MKKIIFLDMDGVLADFDGGLNGNLGNMFRTGFFRNLPVLENNLNETIQELKNRGFGVKILSKAPTKKSHKNFVNQMVDKANWVKEFIPCIDELDIIIQATDESKGEVLKYYPQDEFECYLVDDYTPNLATWAFAGGKCIKKAKRIKNTREYRQILNLVELANEGI